MNVVTIITNHRRLIVLRGGHCSFASKEEKTIRRRRIITSQDYFFLESHLQYFNWSIQTNYRKIVSALPFLTIWVYGVVAVCKMHVPLVGSKKKIIIVALITRDPFTFRVHVWLVLHKSTRRSFAEFVLAYFINMTTKNHQGKKKLERHRRSEVINFII